MRRSDSTSKSLAGSLLLASPKLRDPNFAQTVLLLSVHDRDGAMGIVLNRPTGRTLGDLGGDFSIGALAEVPIYLGGPVQPEQMVICAWRIDEGSPAGFQLHFGIDPERASGLIGQPGMYVRAFMGYAGWSEGQLEGELAAEAWAVTEIPETLMELEADSSAGLWRAVFGEINHEWRLLAEEPDDPSGN